MCKTSKTENKEQIHDGFRDRDALREVSNQNENRRREKNNVENSQADVERHVRRVPDQKNHVRENEEKIIKRMHFLNLVQTDICHPEKVSLVAGPALFCHQCGKGFAVYEYITRISTDHFRSSELAQAFREWTGDENVPMNFTVVDLEGIFSKTIVGQSLNRVLKSLRLLRAINAPFTTRPQVDRFEDMNNFLFDFLNMVKEHPESTAAREIINDVLHSMYELLNTSKESIDLFSTYFDDLVPFVQRCVPDGKPIRVNDSFPNLAREMHEQLQLSSAIRKQFGKFSIPFDMIHVMVCSFACSVDMDVVGNWVMDFIARVCRGRFFWKSYPDCPFVETMNRIVYREVLSRAGSDHYKTLTKITTGKSIEHYSTFLMPFHELQMFLKGKFCRGRHDRVQEMAFHQMFPAVCFTDHGDQLGFTIGHNYLVQTLNRNNGRIVKGMFKTAKSLHRTVQKFIAKIRDFETMPDGSPNTQLLWTVDTFQLFLASDPEYEAEIKSVLRTVVGNKQDGN